MTKLKQGETKQSLTFLYLRIPKCMCIKVIVTKKSEEKREAKRCKLNQGTYLCGDDLVPILQNSTKGY